MNALFKKKSDCPGLEMSLPLISSLLLSHLNLSHSWTAASCFGLLGIWWDSVLSTARAWKGSARVVVLLQTSFFSLSSLLSSPGFTGLILQFLYCSPAALENHKVFSDRSNRTIQGMLWVCLGLKFWTSVETKVQSYLKSLLLHFLWFMMSII